MRRITVLVFLLSLGACKLEPVEQQDELGNVGSVSGGDLNNPADPSTQVATWRSGNLAIYSIDSDNDTFSGRFSFVQNNVRINYYGDFTFSEVEDFNYIFQNKSLFESANNVTLTLKIKLLQKGSSCTASPGSELCLTVMTPDKYEISDVQSLD